MRVVQGLGRGAPYVPICACSPVAVASFWCDVLYCDYECGSGRYGLGERCRRALTPCWGDGNEIHGTPQGPRACFELSSTCGKTACRRDGAGPMCGAASKLRHLRVGETLRPAGTRTAGSRGAHFPSWTRVYSTTSRICAVVRTPANEGMVSNGLARPLVTRAISSSMFGKSLVT